MPQQHPGSAGQHGAPQPDGDQWYRNDRPEGGLAPPPPRPPAEQPGGHGRNGREGRIQPLTVAVIAVIAALAAAAVLLILVKAPSSSPAPATAGGNPPAAGQPAQGGGGGGPFGGGGSGHLLMSGKVTRISSTSITLSAQGHTITAAITSSTQFTGTAKSARAIKPGDTVAATISGYGSPHPVANSISDPAAIP